MRICKAKSKLKRSLQIQILRRNAGDADATVIDGSALLWTVHWPADGSIADFIVNVKKRIASYLTNSDIYLIFDRYHEYSIKSTTQDGRETGITRKHHLLQRTKLPAQKVVLSSVENKKQLIRILCEELTEDRLFLFICGVRETTSWLSQGRILAPSKSKTKREGPGTIWKHTRKS